MAQKNDQELTKIYILIVQNWVLFLDNSSPQQISL